MQPSMFDPEPDTELKPAGDQWVRMRVLITVKAAPTPSGGYGETVCVAGLRLDLGCQGWVRLYPINFRALDGEDQFHKYEVVSLRARPARNDRRTESWRPDLNSVVREKRLSPGVKRTAHVEPHIQHSMCRVLNDVREKPPARSLAVVRPRAVTGLDIERHPGWTDDQRRKIEESANKPGLFGAESAPLQAPRFLGKYRYLCAEQTCRGHRQGILDWEFVALQHRFRHYDDARLESVVRTKFFAEKFRPDRDIAFYVGNQAKREHTFSVLGVYSAPR
jgi:hypothetical protein